MKLAIIGSRTFRDYPMLEKYILENFDITKIEAIVSGEALGADSLSANFAYNHNIPKIIFKPDWQLYGKSAGFIRNKKIVDTADEFVIFWDGMSRGSKHSLDLATGQHKPVRIVKFEP